MTVENSFDITFQKSRQPSSGSFLLRVVKLLCSGNILKSKNPINAEAAN